MKKAPPPPAALRARPIAHRGLHDRGRGIVENALSAIRAAAGAGYGIEIDVQLSADGRAMVFHDETLDRLTGESGRVDARSAEELGRIPLRGGAGETIPTLDAALEALAGSAPLLVEIKDQDGAMGPNVGRLEAATAQALRGYAGPVAVMSFNPHSVAAFRAAAPEIAAGLTSYDYADEDLPAERRAALAGLTDYARLGASFVSYGVDSFPSAAVEAVRASGDSVFCWTVRDAAKADFAYRHADQITFEGFLPEGAR